MITKSQAFVTIGFTLAILIVYQMSGDRLRSAASRSFTDNAHELGNRQTAVSDRPGDTLNSDGTMPGVTLRRTRVYDAQGLQEPKSVLWKTTKLFTRKGFRLSLDIVTANKEAFFQEGDLLYVIDLQTGEVKNRIDLDKELFYSPVVAGGLLFLEAGDDAFYAFDRRDLKTRWKIDKEGYRFVVGSSAVANGMLYLGSVEQIYYVGEEVNFGRRRPKASVYAVDALTGAQKWMFAIKGYPTPIAVADEDVYFGDEDKHLFAVNAKDGREVWRFTASGNIGTPAIMNGRVFFSDEGGNLYAVDQKSGQATWKAAIKNKVSAHIAAYNNMIYCGGVRNGIYAVDALTGQEKWVYRTTKLCLAPVVANGAVYVACQDNTLLAIDAENGQEKWKYKTSRTPYSHPVVGNGVIYYLDEEGVMYALSSS
jgi:eukaryotic-like serine/threonine-protein kinase